MFFVAFLMGFMCGIAVVMSYRANQVIDRDTAYIGLEIRSRDLINAIEDPQRDVLKPITELEAYLLLNAV